MPGLLGMFKCLLVVSLMNPVGNLSDDDWVTIVREYPLYERQQDGTYIEVYVKKESVRMCAGGSFCVCDEWNCNPLDILPKDSGNECFCEDY